MPLSHSIETIAVVGAVINIGLIAFGRWYLNRLAYIEVHGKTKLPMVMCDKHGLIPADSMLHTTAIAAGRPDLDVPLCPICMEERASKVKEMLDGVK